MEIQVKGVSKSFKGIECISDISFTVYAGETVGILAPSGSGKSLLLDLLYNRTLPDKGSITYIVDGKKITPSKIKTYTGYLDSRNPLYEYMIVYDYLHFSADFYNIPSYLKNSRIKSLINSCGLSNSKHKTISELSKGQRQKLGLAQSLVNNPSFLFLDEPVKGLDPKQARQVYDLVKELTNDSTVIITSNKMSEVENMCDTLVVLSNGKILTKGTVSELKKFIADSNILKVKISANNSRDVYEELRKVEYIQIENWEGFDFSIQTTEVDRFAKELFWICAENNWYITRFVTAEKTLEDTFKELRRN